jgi:hypothetical protein
MERSNFLTFFTSTQRASSVKKDRPTSQIESDEKKTALQND